MLSEHEAQSKWRNLFASGKVTPQTLGDAQLLLEQLPLESPLRSRLTAELDEIQKLHAEPKAEC